MPAVFAGSLTSSKITISDSRPSQTGIAHTFTFTTGTTGTIASILFQYCTTASGSCVTPPGLTTTSASQGSLSGIGASTTDASTNGTIILNVTSPASIPSGTTITVPYTGITNPSGSNSSFFVKITSRDGGTTPIDNAQVAFATLTTSSLTMTADVGSTFQVTIAAVTTGSVNGATVNLNTTTADTIPFGMLTSGSTKIAAHDVTVTTNASHGYAITVMSNDPPLTSGSNNIDKFTGTNASPTAWSSPSGGTSNVNTGFIGYTTEDTSLCTGTAGRFVGNKWAGADTTPSEIVCNSNAVNSGETTRIGWQAEVNSLQPPGSYTGLFTIVTTPTY